MTTQDWINEQKIEAVQDRKDGKDYWRTDNLYTEADLIELLEAFALYNVVGQSEQLKAFAQWCYDKGYADVPDVYIEEYIDESL